MRKFRDLLIGSKLALSYSVLILVFFIAGAYTIQGLYGYKKELLATTKGYIPLVENTNRIERLTNQVMQFLWEFTVLGDIEYYDLGKTTLAELNQSIEKTKVIISSSPELKPLQSGLLRITSWTKDLELIIDETLEVQTSLKNSQDVLHEISEDFRVEARKYVISGESKLRYAILDDQIPSEDLSKRHRKNRIVNLIVDKGNNNMISAYDAIASENPEHLDAVFQEFVYINNLLLLLDSLSTEEYEFVEISKFQNHFAGFQNELYALKNNLTKSRELSVRRGEIANVVIFEAGVMGQDGINFAGNTLEENYQVFNRSVPIYFVGLLVALVIAVLFSIMITRSITVPIGESVIFAEEIASGNLDASVNISQHDEVGILAESLKNMGAKLKANMKDLKMAERKMLSISIEAEERERKRMAEDLHDSLGPQLSIIKLYIDALKNPALDLEKKRYLIDSSEETIQEAIIQVKNIAYNLLPNLLIDFGLDMAIRSFCDKIMEVSAIEIDYTFIDYPSNLDRHVESMIFRVIKELLNNTLKHAEATKIDIQLCFDRELLVVDYRDNGVGFDINSVKTSERRGLTNINNRIDYISGRIDFESEPGTGMQVRIEVDRKYLT